MSIKTVDEMFDQIKGQASDYIETQGRAMADDALHAISKKIEKGIVKKIGDKEIKKVVSGGLAKMSSVDDLMEVSGAVGDVREYVEKFMNGELTRAEVVENIAEKTETLISAITEKLATGIAAAEGAGNLAPAIGSAAGYAAAKAFHEAVAPILNAAKRAKEAKERYEFLHGMYEESIRQMCESRDKFEQETATIFANRQDMVDKCFTQIDIAVKSRNVDEVSAALNQIAMEFGSELTFKTLDEFDDFVLNSDKELIL